jgi:hypothetical protein
MHGKHFYYRADHSEFELCTLSHLVVDVYSLVSSSFKQISAQAAKDHGQERVCRYKTMPSYRFLSCLKIAVSVLIIISQV